MKLHCNWNQSIKINTRLFRFFSFATFSDKQYKYKYISFGIYFHTCFMYDFYDLKRGEEC